MTDQERLEIMLEYVAGTLDAPQTEIVRQSLFKGDPTWAAALAEAEATLAAYAAAITPIEAPASAKSALMSRVARSQAAERSAAPEAYRPFRWIAQGFAAVAAMILIGVLVSVYNTRQVNSMQASFRSELAQRDMRIMMLQNVMDRLESQSHDKDARIVAMQSIMDRDGRVIDALHSGNLKLVALGSESSKAVGHILIDNDKATWHIFASALSPLPADKTYELWFITPGQQKIPGGTFNVDAAGNATFTVTLPKDIGPVAIAAVTDEAAGGVQVPAGHIQLKGSVQ